MINKLLHTLLALLALGGFINGQNLILNPSLEEHWDCPNQVFLIYKAKYWYSPGYPFTPYTSPNPVNETCCTSDYFNICSDTGIQISVPQSFFGFQYAFDGNAYYGFEALYREQIDPQYNLQEFATATIVEPLQPNKRYCLSYYINLADESAINIDKIGAYFTSDTLVVVGNLNVFYSQNIQPQVESPAGIFYNDTTNWVKVSGDFIAVGGEKFVTIGNFHDVNNTNYRAITKGTDFGNAYYFIDMLSLELYDDVGVEENSIDKIKIYPNPAQEVVSIAIPKEYTQAQLSIYNLTGQLILQKPITGHQPIPITELGNGMYIFVVQSDDKVIVRQRVVVAK